jgi:TPR repeat protein
LPRGPAWSDNRNMRTTFALHRWLRRAAYVLATVAALGVAPGGAQAGPFEDGVAAYDAGDFETALVLWRPMADQGDARSQYNLGVMYREGQGVTKDGVQAASWFRLASDQGAVLAQFSLGDIFKNGEGVPQDDAQAVHWYKLAAEQGHVQAQYGMGLSYTFGEGVAVDEVQAAYWYRRAAEQGHAYAQYNLGASYNIGAGVPQDRLLAYAWISMAAAQGDTEANPFRDALAEAMTAEELAEAQRLSGELWQNYVQPFLTPPGF